MAYTLAALIGAPAALAGLAAELPGARVVDLTAELALLAHAEQGSAVLAAEPGGQARPAIVASAGKFDLAQ